MQPNILLRRNRFSESLESALFNPIRAFQPKYLPVLMVYFAFGALGLVSVAESFWIKNSLQLTPAELASLSIWLTLPLTVKMVFGELVDCVPLFGSRRRAYVFLGGGLIAVSMLMLASAAGGWLSGIRPDSLYRMAVFVGVIGVVIQEVAADAMSAEVVDRCERDGSPRVKADVDHELGMVQVLGRLAMSVSAFVVAGIAGWVARHLSYSTVFLMALAIPMVSITGAVFIDLKPPESRPINWRVMGAGLGFGLAIGALVGMDVPYNQEIVFVGSTAVVGAMLWFVLGAAGDEVRRTIVFAAVIIFAYRAVPTVGHGFTWFTIDVLGFDEVFHGSLRQMGAGLGLLATWFLSEAMTRRPLRSALLVLTLLTTVAALPGLSLALGGAQWAEEFLGLGPRTLALLDTAATSPFMQLSMIPLLTLVAINAPAGHRAAWFALTASLMNLALIAGHLQTKYLNAFFVVERGSYENLPYIVSASLLIGLVLPVAAILAFGRRLQAAP